MCAGRVGQLDDLILMLTGSDMLILGEARMRFPGRRGRADEVDFHLYPLSFAETVHLKGILNSEQQQSIQHNPSEETVRRLFSAFLSILCTAVF